MGQPRQGGVQMKKGFLISLISVVIISLFISISEAKVPYRVTGEIADGYHLTAYYTIVDSWITYNNGIAYIGIDTQGDCRGYYIPDCHDHFYPPHHWRECRDVRRVDCRNERGYFKLPADKIIYDGKKRLKYIENGKYLTVAKWSRIPLFGGWKLRDYVKIAVDRDLLEASLLIFPEER
jgi:hypothetical protein